MSEQHPYLKKEHLQELLEEFLKINETEPALADSKPAVLAMVFDSGDFVKAGIKGRDGCAMTQAFINMAADEIEVANQNEEEALQNEEEELARLRAAEEN